MKKLRYVLLALLSLILVFSVVACKDDGKTYTSSQYSFSVNSSNVTLEVGDTFEIIASYGKEKITYSVDDNDVATVSNSGLVTALETGTAYVTISAGKEKRTCKINVVKYSYTVELNFSESENMLVGTVLTFSAKLYRDGRLYDGKVTWTTTGASLTIDGAKALFTASQKGVYTVTATSDKGATASCVITVGESINDF